MKDALVSFNIDVNGTIKIPKSDLDSIVAHLDDSDEDDHEWDGCSECETELASWLDTEVEVTSVLYEAFATGVDKVDYIEGLG